MRWIIIHVAKTIPFISSRLSGLSLRFLGPCVNPAKVEVHLFITHKRDELDGIVGKEYMIFEDHLSSNA